MKRFKQYIVIELDEGSQIVHKTNISDVMSILSKKDGKERYLAIVGLADRNVEFLTKEVEIEG